MRPRRSLEKIQKEVLQTAEPPGGFEKLASEMREIPADGEAPGVKALHLPEEAAHMVRAADWREGEAL
jgi:hypothetical protein